MQHFNNILLVIDAKTENRATLERTITLTKRNQVLLTVIDVIKELPRYMRPLMTSKPPAELQKQATEKRSSDLERLIAPIQQEGVHVSTKVLCGTPFLEIIREVLRNQRDLVMMTAEGKGGLKDMLLGSNYSGRHHLDATNKMILYPLPHKSIERKFFLLDSD